MSNTPVNEAMAETIANHVRKAIKDEMKDFYIERETHYQDHMFIKSLRDVFDTSRGEVCKQMANAAVKVILTLMLLGFVAWITLVKKG